MENKLSFEIVESPIIYDVNGEQLMSDAHKAIAKDSGEILSVMKKGYNPMSNSDFMESTERMQQVSGFEFVGYSEINGGKIIISHLKNNEDDLNIGGNKIEDYLVLGNSFDGSYPFFIGTSTVLLRCQNQFSKLSKVNKVRHTKSAPKKIEELMQSLEIYFKNRELMYNGFNKMMTVKIDPVIVAQAKDFILNVSKQDRLDGKISTRKDNQLQILDSHIITEMNALGSNLWGLFNGVTSYTTHELVKQQKGFGNIFGTPAYLNQKAMSFVTKVMNG